MKVVSKSPKRTADTSVTQHVPEIGGYELAESITGLCRGTLYSLVHSRRIPFIRLSKRLIHFRRVDLEVWMNARAVEAR